MLHDRSSGDDDGFGGVNASTGEIWGVEVVEPGSDFIWRGVGKKKANLAFDMLPMIVSVSMSHNLGFRHTRNNRCKPGKCSSSTVLPSPFAITAPRPKIILPELWRCVMACGSFKGYGAHSFQSFRTVFR